MTNEPQHPHRVAVYFAPHPESAWWQAGSTWLGRCARTGVSFLQPEVPGLTPRAFRARTAEPRRYGFHATLKPPFRLADGARMDDVLQALDGLARETAPFTLPPLSVTMLGTFLALRTEGDNGAAHRLAARCVTALHPWAAQLSDEELAQRRQQPLTAEQDALLQRWGYPWVMEQFRFHLSLTGGLATCTEAERVALERAAQSLFHPLPDCRFDSLAVFVEPNPGDDFVWTERVELRG